MNCRILIFTVVLTFFLNIGYGENSLLTALDMETNKKNFIIGTSIKINIEGLRSEKGKLIIAVFNDQNSFEKRIPIQRLVLNKSKNVKNEVVLNLNPGIYGISVLDDENDNNIMDYSFFGIPKEGFGFSDYYHKGLSKPKYNDFNFEVIDEVMKKINIRLRYM